MLFSATREDGPDQAGPADIETSAVAWLRAELDDPEITAGDNFLDVGGHSLTFSRLNKFLGESRGVVLDRRTTYEESLGSAAAKARPVGPSEPAEQGSLT
ncbi:hypothetical protein [Kutzneria sp. 744]|uniref:hypothetical protein n=1 Tax=Kutzneria sp. (strain 744) TaxID=345341 RepID=UPI0004B04D85|nr:hypothetical protein [Kutzneria sp. 744]